jgi:hypothetical protein
MARMGQPLTKKEAEAMLKTMDTNNDGKISYKGECKVGKQCMSAAPQCMLQKSCSWQDSGFC